MLRAGFGPGSGNERRLTAGHLGPQEAGHEDDQQQGEGGEEEEQGEMEASDATAELIEELQRKGVGKLFGPGTPTTDLIDYIKEWFASKEGASPGPARA